MLDSPLIDQQKYKIDSSLVLSLTFSKPIRFTNTPNLDYEMTFCKEKKSLTP